jgi:hypothetical protein
MRIVSLRAIILPILLPDIIPIKPIVGFTNTATTENNRKLIAVYIAMAEKNERKYKGGI